MMLKQLEVNVLGVCYSVYILGEKDETMIENECDGYTLTDTKFIAVLNHEDSPLYTLRVLKHELIHAFLFECGMDIGYGFHTEALIDFLSIQFDKLGKVLKSVEGGFDV